MDNAPEHLAPTTREWWQSIVSAYQMDSHQIKLLTLAAVAWDRHEIARKSLDANGLTFEDRLGNPRARPEVGIARDASQSFARLIREIGLDLGEAEVPRGNSLRHYG